MLPRLSSPQFDKLHKIYIYVLILSILSHTKQDIPSFWGAAFLLLLLGYVRAPYAILFIKFQTVYTSFAFTVQRREFSSHCLLCIYAFNKLSQAKVI